MARKRMRASWGSNEATANGKRRIRYWADLHDGKGYRRVSETVDGTRREADLVLARRRVEHCDDVRTCTVSQAAEAWWIPWIDRRVSDGRMSASSRDIYINTYRKHVKQRWGNSQLGSIRASEAQDWLLSLPYTAAHVSKVVMSKIYGLARFHDVECENPFAKSLEMPPKVKARRSVESYSLEELGDVWAAVRGSSIEAPFILAAFGSCRVGESLAVRADEVELCESNGVPVAVVPIRRQAGRMPGMVTDRLKTSTSRRWVVIPGPMGERLGAIAGERAGAGREWLCGVGSEPGWQSWFRKNWDNAIRQAGLRVLTPSTLRPAWQTVSRYTLHVDQLIIERLMGHKTPGVTGQHYDRPHRDDFIGPVAEAYARHPYADNWDN